MEAVGKFSNDEWPIEDNLLGRPSNHTHHAPRTIDLDILYYDNLSFTLPELTLPHPRITERAFVLHPLADIAPTRILPGQTQPIAALLEKILPKNRPSPTASF